MGTSGKSLESIRQFWTVFPLIRKLGDQQRERLGVTRDSQWPRVHRLEPHIVDQLSRNLFALGVVAAIHEAGFGGSAASGDSTNLKIAVSTAK